MATTGANSESWNSFAEQYNSLSKQQKDIPAFFAAIASESLASSLGSEPISFLDVAAGPGTMTCKLADKMASMDYQPPAGSKFVVTDFAPTMVNIARGRIEAHPVFQRWGQEVHVMEMDGVHPTIEERTVTHLGCMLGIMFFPDRALGLQNLHKLLTPNGKAVFSTWNEQELSKMLIHFGCSLGVSEAELLEADSRSPVWACRDPLVFKQEMEAAGFADVQVTPHSGVFHLPAVDSTFQAFVTNPVYHEIFPFLSSQDKESMIRNFDRFLHGDGSKWLESTAEGEFIVLHMTANIAVASAGHA